MNDWELEREPIYKHVKVNSQDKTGAWEDAPRLAASVVNVTVVYLSHEVFIGVEDERRGQGE